MASKRRRGLRVLLGLVVVAAAAAAIAYANVALLRLAADTNDHLGELKATVPGASARPATPKAPSWRPAPHPTPRTNRTTVAPSGPSAQDSTSTIPVRASTGMGKGTSLTGSAARGVQPSRTKGQTKEQGEIPVLESAVSQHEPASSVTMTSESRTGAEPGAPEHQNEPEPDD